MKRIAEALLKVSLYLAIASTFAFAVIGLAQVGLSSDGKLQDATLTAIAALLFVLAIAIGLCGFALDTLADHRATKEAIRRRRNGQ